MSEKIHTTSLNIAGFELKLHSDTEIQLEEGYREFISIKDKADFNIECIASLPIKMFETDKAVFEAENSEQKFYSIYQTKTGLGFVIYNQQDKNSVQQNALLDMGFRNWTLYSNPTEEGFFPLTYPMGPIIMHYMTLKSDAVMIHASCAYDGEKGRIFTGFSGTGKSTMAKIWQKKKHQIINDDRLIIRRENGEFFVYNTPMYYIDIPKRAPLHSIFIISHSSTNKIENLQGAMALSKTMAFCIQNNFDKQFIQNRLDFLNKLIEKVDVYDLGFVPNNDIIDFIISNARR